MLSLKEAGQLYIQSQGKAGFKVFCSHCNGWFDYRPMVSECASCKYACPEAQALNAGIHAAEVEAAAALTKEPSTTAP